MQPLGAVPFFRAMNLFFKQKKNIKEGNAMYMEPPPTNTPMFTHTPQLTYTGSFLLALREIFKTKLSLNGESQSLSHYHPPPNKKYYLHPLT